MAIKTLLVAGVTTLGLCTGAFAQTQTANTTSGTQTNTSTQAAAAFAFGGTNIQRGFLARQSQDANALGQRLPISQADQCDSRRHQRHSSALITFFHCLHAASPCARRFLL